MRVMTLRSLFANASLAVLFVAAFAGPRAAAQWPEPAMQVNIPYPFVVASKRFPPATYGFATTDQRNMFLMQPAHGSPIAVFVPATIDRPDGFLGQGAIVFDNNGAQRTIAELWLPGNPGFLMRKTAPSDTRDVVIGDFLMPAGRTSGQRAFSMTCARCHGADGNGEPSADSFFHRTIPRLTSPAVRAKSDAELKKLINQGDRVMPPVETDEGGFSHRLPPQDVDAVIAYVRTLKR